MSAGGFNSIPHDQSIQEAGTASDAGRSGRPEKLHTLYDVKTWGDRKTQDISVGASIPVATGTIRAGYTRANRSGGAAGSGYADADDSTRLAVGYVHDLSKRTALYGTISRITNKGAARSSVLGSPPAGMLGGENSSGYEVGLRHTF